MICSNSPRIHFFLEPTAVIAIANSHVFQVWKSPKQLRHHFDDFIEALVAPLGLKCPRATRFVGFLEGRTTS
jgi:hypothetical protein